MKKHPSSLVWSRLAANDLAMGEFMRLRVHTWRCGRCAEEARQLRQEARAFRASPAFARGLARLQAPARAPERARRGWGLRWAAGGMGVLAACAVLLAVGLDDRPAGLRAKGGDVAFEMYVQQDGGSLPLGMTCRAGDRLRMSYRTTQEHPYLMVLELDGAGRVDGVFPADDPVSGCIGPGSGLTPDSRLLDATPGEERFVALFSAKPLDRSTAEGFARGGRLPEGVRRVEVMCSKRP